MSDELKLCAHCGGEPSLSTGYGWKRSTLHFVECIDCATMSCMYPDQKDTIKAWNARAPEHVGATVYQLGKCQQEFHELHTKHTKLLAFVESLTMREFAEDHLKACVHRNAVSIYDEIPAAIALRARQVLEEIKNE